MISNEIIYKKLAVLLKYYKEFRTITDNITLEEYKNNIMKKRSIEREIQLIVEFATDINNIILKKLESAPAKDYFNSFIELSENDIISIDFALAIAPSTGLRNILVHEYQTIDDSIVYKSISNIMTLYKRYLRLISDYLDCNMFLK